jgi:predicted amidohydrolase YtcJ
MGSLCGFSSAQNAAAPSDSGPKADIIFIHANLYTGVPADTPFSSILRAEAMAVRGDRIQAIGKAVDIQKLKGPQTQVVDLGGHFVMPGFNDAHLHLADGAGTWMKSRMGIRCFSQESMGISRWQTRGLCNWEA